MVYNNIECKTQPEGYKCILLDHSDFKDWKTFSQAMFPNSIKINFSKLRSVIFEKNNPVIRLSYGYFDISEIKELDMNSIARSRRNSALISNGPLRLYENKLSISSPKYIDSLCDRNTIPKKITM